MARCYQSVNFDTDCCMLMAIQHGDCSIISTLSMKQLLGLRIETKNGISPAISVVDRMT